MWGIPKWFICRWLNISLSSSKINVLAASFLVLLIWEQHFCRVSYCLKSWIFKIRNTSKYHTITTTCLFTRVIWLIQESKWHTFLHVYGIIFINSTILTKILVKSLQFCFCNVYSYTEDNTDRNSIEIVIQNRFPSLIFSKFRKKSCFSLLSIKNLT